MKFRFGSTSRQIKEDFENERQYEKQWHKWYAWYPVCVNEDGFGKAKWVWLEDVWRKDDDSPWVHNWIYKEA